MTDSEKAAQEILEWLKESSFVDDIGYIHTDGLDPEIARVEIRQIIDKHLC